MFLRSFYPSTPSAPPASALIAEARYRTFNINNLVLGTHVMQSRRFVLGTWIGTRDNRGDREACLITEQEIKIDKIYIYRLVIYE